MDEFDLPRIRRLLTDFNNPRIREIIFKNKKSILDFLEGAKSSLEETKKMAPEYYDVDEYREIRKYIPIVSNISAPPTAILKEAAESQKDASKLNKVSQKVVAQEKTSARKATKAPAASKPKVSSRKPRASTSTSLVAIQGSDRHLDKIVVSKSSSSEPTNPSKIVKSPRQSSKMTGDQQFELEMKRLEVHDKQLTLKEKSLKLEQERLIVSKQEEERRGKKDADSMARFASTQGLAEKRMQKEEREQKRKITFLKSDIGQQYTKDKNKTKRTTENARARAATKKLQAAEIRRDVTLAQIADRQRRDAERNYRNQQKELERKKDARSRDFQNALERASPDLAFAYSLLSKVGGRVKAGFGGGMGTTAGMGGGPGGTVPPKSSGFNWKEAVPELGGWLAAGAAIGKGAGALGRGAMGIGRGAMSLGSKFSASMMARQQRANPVYSNPAAKGGVGGGVAGKMATKFATRLPIVGGLLAGGMEYSESGNFGKSSAVAGGAIAGATLGAAAGLALGPGGAILGAIIGGVAGESGMRALYNKFMGKSDEIISDIGTPSAATPASQRVFSGKVPPDAGNQANPWKPPTSTGTKSYDKNISKMITDVANEHGIPPDHLLAIAQMESRMNPNAVSPTGATGLFQFTKDTAGDFNLKDRTNPLENTKAAAQLYLKNKKYLLSKGEDPSLDNIYLAHQQGARGATELLKASRGSGAISQDVLGNMSLNVGKNAGGKNAQEKASKFIQANRNALSKAKSSIMGLVDAQGELDADIKASSSSPAPVNVVNGGGANVNNVSNTTVINAPDTDPTIIKLGNHGMFPARFL